MVTAAAAGDAPATGGRRGRPATTTTIARTTARRDRMPAAVEAPTGAIRRRRRRRGPARAAAPGSPPARRRRRPPPGPGRRDRARRARAAGRSSVGATAPRSASHASLKAAVSTPSAAVNASSSVRPSAYERISVTSASCAVGPDQVVDRRDALGVGQEEPSAVSGTGRPARRAGSGRRRGPRARPGAVARRRSPGSGRPPGPR